LTAAVAILLSRSSMAFASEIVVRKSAGSSAARMTRAATMSAKSEFMRR